ncbi:Ger(x)C family spore germination protein [Paenibacillus harenae]|uniref:Ger(x)C family spore germination protein n=1 Tax=Paenibacillus harenae TaxID=306543 RepID=UPI0004087788|nr:Ger(x)C family spore germination protein [Paenibacillus harenae]
MIYRITLIGLCLLMLAGCWSRRELDELLVVVGIGVDWEEGEYLVSFQTVNPSEISMQKSTSDRPPVTLFQGRGKSVFEAARSLTAEAPRKVYMGHLQLLILSETLAKKGINDVLDGMLRDNEARMDFHIEIARGMKAEKLLKLYTPLEKLPTHSMQRSLITSEKAWAPTVSVTLDEVMNRLSGEGFELALPGIQLIGDRALSESKTNIEKFQPPSRFRYMGIAAFKEDKMIGWLSEKESKGYTDITDNLTSTSIELACGDRKYTGIEVISSKSKLETKLRNGKPEIIVHILTEANIVDSPCMDVDVTDPATINRLQEETAQVLKSNAEAAVRRAKRMKSDILGFGNKFGKEHPGYWKQVEDSWNDQYFPLAKVEFDIELYIRKTGTTGKSTLKK